MHSHAIAPLCACRSRRRCVVVAVDAKLGEYANNDSDPNGLQHYMESHSHYKLPRRIIPLLVFFSIFNLKQAARIIGELSAPLF